MCTQNSINSASASIITIFNRCFGVSVKANCHYSEPQKNSLETNALICY